MWVRVPPTEQRRGDGFFGVWLNIAGLPVQRRKAQAGFSGPTLAGVTSGRLKRGTQNEHTGLAVGVKSSPLTQILRV